MKKSVTFALCALLVSGFTATAQAQVTVSGQVRARTEFDKKSFSKGATTLNETYLRTRVNVKADVKGNAHVFVQFQDSRVLGALPGASAGIANNDNIDVHQAYLSIDNLFGEGWGLMAGRFVFNLGNQRLFGEVGWSNIGRSMEGAALWYDNENLRFTAWDVKAIEAMNPLGNSDFDVYGAHLSLKPQGVELWSAYEFMAEKVDLVDMAGAPLNQTDNKLKRLSFGGYLKRRFERVDVTANAVFQTGKRTDESTITTGSYYQQDISALLLAGEIGLNFEGPRNARVAAGVDYASGDDDPADGSFKAFNNLYYTGHAFRGYMDYFIASDIPGLMDLMLRGKVDVTRGWTFKSDLHYFTTAQNYADPLSPGNTTKDVGIEVDLTLATTRVEGAKIVGGASIFLPQDSFAGMTDNEAGVWGYLQTIINFE